MLNRKILYICIIFICCSLFTGSLLDVEAVNVGSSHLVITDDGIDFDSVKNNKIDEDSSKNIKLINSILAEYRGYIVWGSAVVSLTMIGAFIYNLIQLGNSRGNPQARTTAIMGLIFTGIATALSGSVVLLVQMFAGYFK